MKRGRRFFFLRFLQWTVAASARDRGSASRWVGQLISGGFRHQPRQQQQQQQRQLELRE